MSKNDFKRSESEPVLQKKTLAEFLESDENIEDYYIMHEDKSEESDTKPRKKIFIRVYSQLSCNIDDLCCKLQTITGEDLKIEIEFIQKSFYW